MGAGLSLEEKFREALDLKAELAEGRYDTTIDRKRKKGHDLPKYVSYCPQREGYYVRVPGYPKRFFASAKLTREEKLEQAQGYLASLEVKRAVQRLNGCGPAQVALA